MSAAESIYIPRKVWTRAEVASRSWDELSLELIEGDLIDRMGKRPPHIFWKNNVTDWLHDRIDRGHVQGENPIDVAPEDNPTSQPEPDVIVTRRPNRELKGVNPKPEDLRLVVEISDSSFDLDSKVKARLYARAGIREYWLVDIRNVEIPRFLRHLNPVNGQYTVTIHAFEEKIELLPGHVVSLKDMLD